jgi:flagellar basal body P-ring formation protein FlgA
MRQNLAALRLAQIVLHESRTMQRRPIMTTFFGRAAMIGMAIPATAQAETFQNLDQVDAVANAIVAQSGVAVRPADRRMKLAQCPRPLTAEAQAQGAVAVRCAALGWRIRLPVEGVARADGLTPVIIRRGDPVTVEYEAQGFSVTASGVAESEARRGEPVRVRVDQKSSPVMGEAADVGSVRIGGLKE